MKKLALSSVAAVVVTVGIYHGTLALGVAEPVAAAAFAAAFAVVAAAFAFAFAAAFAVASAAAFAVAAAAFAFAAAAAAEDSGIKKRWAFGIVGAEFAAILGALTIGGPLGLGCAVLGIALIVGLWAAHARVATATTAT